jgi:hypothetical protein
MQAKRKEQKGGWAAQKRTLKRAPSRALSSFGSGATGPRDMARNSRPRKSHAMPCLLPLRPRAVAEGARCWSSRPTCG